MAPRAGPGPPKRSNPMPDWRDPEAYAFTAHLTREQWAWEFLRRNPDYRREWAVFVATWRDLEAAYGSPPNRDFPAWRQDARAWVRASECPGGECRVDQDRVLIECALGARWGFHKFPPDPADNDPVGAGRLTWRAMQPDPVLELGPEDLAGLGVDPCRVALGFDLSRPLRAQVEQAKRQLQMLQRQRVRDGTLTLASVAGRRDRWARALRLLDAEAAGAGPDALASVCGANPVVALRAEARGLRDSGYRDIPIPPEV
jgi:hypothetical protein